MKFHVAAVAPLVVLAFAPAAQALEMSGEMYVVGTLGRSNIGYSEMQVDNNRLFARTLSSGTGYNSTQEQNSRVGAKLQLGYQFSPNFAIEGGYVNLGKTTYTATSPKQTVSTTTKLWNLFPVTTNTTIPASSGQREYKITGWNLVGVAYYPVSEKLSLLGKAGMIRAEVKASGSGNAIGGGDATVTKWKPTFGLGGDYNINKEFGVRAEYERFNGLGDTETTGSANVGMFSMGVVGRF